MYAEPRYTKDLDIAVLVSPPDHLKLFTVLKEFGAPTHLVKAEDFLQEDFVFYFGAPPWRIDVLTSIPGVDMFEAYRERVVQLVGSQPANFISRAWLIKAKRASGRTQDLADAEALEAAS